MSPVTPTGFHPHKASASASVTTAGFALRDGRSLGAVGYGTLSVSPFKQKSRDETAHAVYQAIKIGYRHFDTAYLYGNEKGVGQGIRKAIEDGLVTREEVVVVTKLWNTFHGREKEGLALSLDNLGLDYVDIFLVHWPVAWEYHGDTSHFPGRTDPKDETSGKILVQKNKPLRETWQAMHQLVASGKTRAWGVSNHNIEHLVAISKMDITQPVCNQIEVNPYAPQDDLVNYCVQHGIVVVAWAPQGGTTSRMDDMANPTLLQNPVVSEVAKKHAKSATQILMRWAIQKMCCVIPGTSNIDHMKENADLFSFSLDDSDMDLLAGLKRHDKATAYRGWFVPMGLDAYVWE